MVETIDIKARWDARKESAADCAGRMFRFLRRLAACDEVFAQGWLKCGNSLEEALQNKVRVSQEILQNVFERGRNRRDKDKSVIEELGFYSGRFWNGLDREAAHVSVHCGAYVDPAKMPGINEVGIQPPYVGAAADRLLQAEKLREIVTLLAEEWNPDWVRASTFQVDEILYPVRPYRGQRVGWLTYISARYGPLPPLPPNCRSLPINDTGNLIVIDGIIRVSEKNSGDVKKLKELSACLDEAGFLTEI
ncbi:MAG: Imm52 family immunity protein [Limisphaerales bacterium]